MTIAAVLANTVVVTNAVAAGVVGGRTDGSAAAVADGRWEPPYDFLVNGSCA